MTSNLSAYSNDSIKKFYCYINKSWTEKFLEIILFVPGPTSATAFRHQRHADVSTLSPIFQTDRGRTCRSRFTTIITTLPATTTASPTLPPTTSPQGTNAIKLCCPNLQWHKLRLDLESRIERLNSFGSPVWPDKSRQISIKVAQKWFDTFNKIA